MLIYGTGETGLAIIGLQATQKDVYTSRPFHRLPMVWRALSSDRLDGVLAIALAGSFEQLPASKIAERGREALALCKDRGIRCIIAIGSPVLRAISPVHGKLIKLVGSTITCGEVPYIIPVDTHLSGYRPFRSYAWIQAMARFIRRGLQLAGGHGSMYEFPPLVTGDNPAAFVALEEIYAARLPIGLDIETTGTNWKTDLITAVGIANCHGAVSIPWARYDSALYGPQVGLLCAKTDQLMRAILRDPGITKVLHNGIFDVSVLREKDIEVGGPTEDTLLAHKICHPDLFHNLQFCAALEFAIEPWKTQFDLARKRRNEGDEWTNVSRETLLTYNAQDAAIELPLWDRLSAKLDETPHGWANYRKLMSLADLAADMQYHGVRIDLAARDALRLRASATIADIETQWRSMHREIPLMGTGSKKLIDILFFKTLGAPVIATSLRTGARQLTSAVLLEYASSTNPELANTAWLLFRYRKAKKALDAFLTPLTTDRVHARPNPAGTRGSRFSYSDPNLQQWSKEKSIISPLTKEHVELVPSLRNLVCPDDGFVLGEHDYNALEVRLVAYAAGIDEWLEWLAAGVDMHTRHVKLMFGRDVQKSDPLRHIAKVLTFARFYNRRRSVSQALRILKPAMPSLTEAFLEDIFERFDKVRPEVVAWQDSVERTVTKLGYVELPLSGMRQHHSRYDPDINAALSYGIQSTGGDIINAAALRIRVRLNASAGERILLNVHDALLWQAPPGRVHAVAAIVGAEMECPLNLWGHSNIVFPTEAKVGPNWRDLKPIH